MKEYSGIFKENIVCDYGTNLLTPVPEFKKISQPKTPFNLEFTLRNSKEKERIMQ